MGSGMTLNRAIADETAPAKKEHCERCKDKHAKGSKDCGEKCEHCKKAAATECEHCKGQKDCSKCHDKAEKKAEKSAAHLVTATFVAV